MSKDNTRTLLGLCALDCHQPLTLGAALVGARSLNQTWQTNRTGDGKDMSGLLKLAEALPHSQLTSLR